MNLSRSARGVLAVAAASALLSLALFWPGFTTYDGVLQYGQALSGRYDDWHPPVMARLWSVLILAKAGAGPMLALQLGGWWIGLGLLAAALVRVGRRRAAFAIGLIAIWPPFLGWQAAVLKDAQLVAALVAATGVIATYCLRARPMPRPVLGLVAALIGYALLVRANAVFAVAPLLAALPGEGARLRTRILIGGLVLAGTLALSPIVNHRVFGAQASGVEKTQPLYDLAGIAVRAGAADPGFTDAEVAALRTRHCVRSYFWDPLGDPAGCADVTARRLRATTPSLYRDLAAAALRHPVAYAAHRLAHLNATMRWWVPAGWPGAAPPLGSEPNSLGLAQPGAAAVAWQRVAGALVMLPLGWPILWVVLAMGALSGVWRGTAPTLTLSRALLLSALGLEASFAVISIAADLRYHLWAMIATALALVLAGRGAWTRRSAVVTGAVVLAVVAVGGVARATLPVPPADYAAWMRWTGD